MNTIKKCIITKYDKTIIEPPFLRIKLDEVEVIKPEIDDLGVIFAQRLKNACADKGYIFKFYTKCYEEGIDYELVVYDSDIFKNDYEKI